MHKILFPALFFVIVLATCACQLNQRKNPPLTLTDIDGNRYRTITIGTQVWMAEDLRVTRYLNGNPIPRVSNRTDWIQLSQGAYCYYNNDSLQKNVPLYNGMAVNDERGLAPQGWRIPSDEDFQKLIDYLGGERVAGKKMKALSETWKAKADHAGNESQFSSLPAGYREFFFGNFHLKGYNTFYWSSTKADQLNAWIRGLSCSDSSVSRTYADIHSGFSVRCVMNDE